MRPLLSSEPEPCDEEVAIDTGDLERLAPRAPSRDDVHGRRREVEQPREKPAQLTVGTVLVRGSRDPDPQPTVGNAVELGAPRTRESPDRESRHVAAEAQRRALTT